MELTDRRASILAVDDDAKNLLALQGLLTDGCVRVVTARSGQEALDHVLKEEFAVILLDARMQGVDGFATARRIREQQRSRHTPIIFLTAACDDAPSVTRGYEAGAVDYLVKPLRPEILKAKVAVFVELYRKNVKLVEEIHERKRAEQELRDSQQNLRALAAQLQSVREEEWLRIAREIHDELGQTLTILKLELQWLLNRLPEGSQELQQKGESMAVLIDSTLGAVQRIVSGLRPDMLDQLGLLAAIAWQAGEFQRRSGIRCDVALPADELQLDRQRSTAAFRILQELLTNVARHANATHINVVLRCEPQQLILTVEDNGRGIDGAVAASPGSLGLTGVRERVLPFGGQVNISGVPQHGTVVRVTIPRD